MVLKPPRTGTAGVAQWPRVAATRHEPACPLCVPSRLQHALQHLPLSAVSLQSPIDGAERLHNLKSLHPVCGLLLSRWGRSLDWVRGRACVTIQYAARGTAGRHARDAGRLDLEPREHTSHDTLGFFVWLFGSFLEARDRSPPESPTARITAGNRLRENRRDMRREGA